MWYYRSPQVVFGEDALEELDQISAPKALIVTDPVLKELGLADRVAAHLQESEITFFAEVEPEPSLQTALRGAELATSMEPDLIIAVGGGSVIDATKAIVILYENPGIDIEGVSPWLPLEEEKAQFIAVPTTSGTGSEATMGTVLTNLEEKRKVTSIHPRMLPSLAVVDPVMTQNLPPRITGDTGMDVLSHAIDAYGATYHNDFADGMCLKAVQLVFEHLARAVAEGAEDMEARERMGNAATIAGLGISNSNISLTHALGHSFGAYFKMPHGRVMGLFLPYTVEYSLNVDAGTRYVDLARISGLTDSRDEQEGGRALVTALRNLAKEIGQPLSAAEMGIGKEEYQAALETLCDNALSDMSIICSPRDVEIAHLRKLFEYVYEGKPIDF